MAEDGQDALTAQLRKLFAPQTAGSETASGSSRQFWPAMGPPAPSPPGVETRTADPENDWALAMRLHSEEADTEAVFGDLTTAVLESRAGADGSIWIGPQRYARTECGATARGHSRACFYLAMKWGDAEQALALKTRIAPRASAAARGQGVRGPNFALSGVDADTEVVWECVRALRVPIVVYNSRARLALLFRTPGCSSDPRDYECLHTDGHHYQRLKPVAPR